MDWSERENNLGTIPQELSSLQLTGEPVLGFKERRNPEVPNGSA